MVIKEMHISVLKFGLVNQFFHLVGSSFSPTGATFKCQIDHWTTKSVSIKSSLERHEPQHWNCEMKLKLLILQKLLVIENSFKLTNSELTKVQISKFKLFRFHRTKVWIGPNFPPRLEHTILEKMMAFDGLWWPLTGRFTIHMAPSFVWQRLFECDIILTWIQLNLPKLYLQKPKNLWKLSRNPSQIFVNEEYL